MSTKEHKIHVTNNKVNAILKQARQILKHSEWDTPHYHRELDHL